LASEAVAREANERARRRIVKAKEIAEFGVRIVVMTLMIFR